MSRVGPPAPTGASPPAGVYLPLLWEQSFCWKSPIALGYTRGHFSALVAMENDGYGARGAGANLNTDDDITITFLPLVDSERKLLHVHFLSAQEVSARPRPPPWGRSLGPWWCWPPPEPVRAACGRCTGTRGSDLRRG